MPTPKNIALVPLLALPLQAQFAAPQELTHTVDGAVDVLGVDLDADGHRDVLVTALSEGSVVWFPGAGNGEVLDPITIGNLHFARAVVSADFDGDGDLDVVAAGNEPSVVALYEATGPGTFAPAQVLATLPTAILELALGDLDSDGHRDILVTSLSSFTVDGCVCWLRNLGGNAFLLEDSIPGTAGVDAAASDLDGDGDQDLAVADASDDRFLWLENLGGGSFAPPHVLSPGGRPWDVEVADLDGDGDVDILAVDEADHTVGWFENLGGGSFAAEVVISGVVARPTDADVGDVDGDGDLDLVYATLNDHRVIWQENLGAGVFGPMTEIGSLFVANGVDWSDQDGDGDLDLLVSSSAGVVGWYENVGAASSSGFGTLQEMTFRADSIQSVHGVDLDGDGDIDGLSTSFGDDKVAWYENLGGSSFEPRVLSTHTGVSESRVADLDGDGRLDVVVNSRSTNSLSWWRNEGNGAFSTALPVGNTPGLGRALAVMDVEEDGDIDVLATSSSSTSVLWFENDGFGGFSGPLTVGTGANYGVELEVGDIDGDGRTDVAVLLHNSSSLRWFHNRGAGTFDPVDTIASGIFEPRSFELVDVDLDGDLDSVWAESEFSRVWWCETLAGTGNFGPAIPLSGTSYFPGEVLAADLDMDLDPDLLVARYGTPTLDWIENLGGGAWAQPVPAADVLDDYRALGVGDFDLDGDPDVICGALNNDKVSWLENLLVPTLGERSCNPAVPNSTDLSGTITAFGSPNIVDNEFSLYASELPPHSTTIFITSATSTPGTMVPGVGGLLCLGSPVLRLVGPGQVGSSGTAGQWSIQLDLSSITVPGGTLAIQPGSTWYYQAWYRDVVEGQPTSNLTDSVGVFFQ